MALTLTTVTGIVDMPGGDTPVAARLIFELTGIAVHGGNIFVQGPQVFPVSASGSFSVQLQSTVGLGVAYQVSVGYRVLDTGQDYIRRLGLALVPDTGPVQLTSILSNTPPAPDFPEWLREAFDARDEAEAAAATAALYAPAYYPSMPAFWSDSKIWPVGTDINARTGELVRIVAPGAGSYNHPTSGQGVRVVPVGNRYPLSAFMVIFGRGQSDAVMAINRAQLKRAIEVIAAAGGGWLVVPDILEVNGFVPLLPKVSLDLTGGGLVNPVTEVISYGYGQVLLPGNFHPDFTEDFTYYPAVTPAFATRTLTITGQGSRFSVGDQVFIASELAGETAGFAVPLYAWLNVVESVSGDAVTFRHPVDVPGIALGVARLADETCRDGITAFFWQDAEIRGGRIECAVWHWSSDTAMLDCRIEGLTSVSAGAIYGNTFQRVRWVNCDFYFRTLIGEQSHNSYDTINDGCRFTFCGVPGYNALGPSIQEEARRIVYRNFLMDFGDSIPTSHVLRAIDASNVLFEDGTVIGRGSSGMSAIVLGTGAWPSNVNASFRADHNAVRRVRLLIPCARHALITTHEFSTDQWIEDCEFMSEPASGETIRIVAGASTLSAREALHLRRNQISSGSLAFDGAGVSEVRLDMIDSPIPGGVTDTAVLTRVRGRQSARKGDEDRRRDFRRALNNLVWVNGAYGPLPMGNPVGSTAVFEIEGIIVKQGAGKDNLLQLRFYDATDTLIATASATIPAANSGTYLLAAKIHFSPEGMVCAGELKRITTGAITTMNVFAPTLTNVSDVRMRIAYQTGTGPGDEGDSSLRVRSLRADVQNVYDWSLGR